MNVKNEKGITLITLVITVILILIISGMMGYYSINGINMQRINEMYSDIEQIQTEIDSYYIKNNKLPLADKIEFNISNCNPNDDKENYYIIDLSKLGNLSLNYGKEFESIKNNNTGNYTDIYIINTQSQTIYYLKGIEFEEKVYYTKPIEYNEIQN